MPTEAEQPRPHSGPEPSQRASPMPVLSYRSEAEDERPPDAPNIIAGTASILLVVPCVAMALAIVVLSPRADWDAGQWVTATSCILAALVAAGCCVVAARHHFRRRPPAVSADREPVRP